MIHLDFTMRSVLVAQQGLVAAVDNKTIFTLPTFKQDKSQEIRYTKNQDFNNEIANEFLQRDIQLDSESFLYPELINPIFG